MLTELNAGGMSINLFEYLTRISKNSPTSIGGEMNCYLLHSAIVGM